MVRWFQILLAGLLLLVLPAVAVTQEYSRRGPGALPGLPYQGVHLEANVTPRFRWLSHWSWVRTWVRWDEIELQPGVYSWEARQDENLAAIKQAGFPLLLTIITTPDWARQNPRLRCSPPQPGYLDDFAAFVNALIDRYQPQAIELGNEPEIPPELIGNLDAWMGCWGPGGAYYAQMLKTVYPAVKARHPGVTVVAGSLMLDQNQLGFWQDVLAAGGKAHYDAVSFHAYVYYPINEYRAIQDKVDYLRGLGETAPLWLSETSMLCFEERIECGLQFELAQADYYRYIAQNYAEIGLDRFFWFTLTDNEWRHSDLVNGNRPKPAWYEYWKASSILRRAAGGGK